MKKLCKVG